MRIAILGAGVAGLTTAWYLARDGHEVEVIERNHGVKIDIDEIPLDDEKTYALYQRGDTIGTFQFESEGMRQYLKDLKPTNIEDLIAMNALYRPGPMQFIPNFINRKHGREDVVYPHELLKPILEYSQGIMVPGGGVSAGVVHVVGLGPVSVQFWIHGFRGDFGFVGC